MIRLSELEVMVCDLFVDAYRAGTFGRDVDFGAARGCRARLIEKLGEVYAELEFETGKREALEVELMHANRQLAEEKEMSARKDALLEKLLGPGPDDIAPDDMEPELRDCIPFPDVEDLAPASEVLGGDE